MAKCSLILAEAPFNALEDDVKDFVGEVLSEDGAVIGVSDLVELLAPYLVDAGLVKDEAEVQKLCQAFYSKSGFSPPSRVEENDALKPLPASLMAVRSETVMSGIPEDATKEPSGKLAVGAYYVANPGGEEKESGASSNDSEGGNKKGKAKAKGKLSRKAKERQDKKKEGSRENSSREGSVEPGNKANGRNLSDVAAFGLEETEEGLDAFGSSDITGKGHLYLIKQAEKYRDIVLPAVYISIVSDLGQADLINGSPLRLMRGQRYGLIGRNGSGKTTLLRRIARRALPGLPPLRYGYVAQELTGSDASVLEVACAGDTEHAKLLQERTRLEEALTSATDDTDTAALSEEFSEICERCDVLASFYGPLGIEGHARDVLIGLQFTSEMIDKPSRALSGGWRMRLALAQALLSRADCLLLDEPTNHLDLVGVLWLQQYLSKKISSDCILVMISHDRGFLDHVTTDTVEIRNKKIEQGSGNYSEYQKAREEEGKGIQARLDATERQEKKQAETIQKLKEQTQKKGKDADPNKQRQAKERQIKLHGKVSSSGEATTYGRAGMMTVNGSKYRASYAHEGMVDIHELAADKLSSDGPKMKMKLLEPEELDGVLLETENACFRIAEAKNPMILRNVKINIQPKCRIAVVGPNGAGKTTLLRLLKGEQWPDNKAQRHRKLKIAHVSQNHLQDMEAHLTEVCVSYFRTCLPPPEPGQDGSALSNKSPDQALITYLANFGLGPQSRQKVGTLSGGQKARLAFATQVWFKPHLLLLDEPTNHLDMDTLDALAEALRDFAGAAVIVSHNQHFLTSVCNELWIVDNGQVSSSGRGDQVFASKFAEYRRAALRKLRV